MKLIIEKLGTFEIDGDVTFNDTSVKLASSELFTFVDDLQQEEEAPEAPAPPEVKAKVEVTYESAPGCKFSMEKLEKAGWTLSAMIEAGHVIEVEVEVEETPPAPEEIPPAPEEIPPAPEVVLGPNQFELDGSVYEMQAVAKGVTYEKFMESSGWSLALLIKHKFCTLISAPKVEAVPEAPKVEAVPEAPKVEAVPEAPRTKPSKEKMDPGAYPFLNDEGDWEDINGDIFDSDVHGMSKDTKTPSIKNDGAFKARRNVNKKSESVPAAPKEVVTQTIKENDTAAAPPPPPADDDTAPPPPADDGSNDANSDEDLDSELANLVKQWGN